MNNKIPIPTSAESTVFLFFFKPFADGDFFSTFYAYEFELSSLKMAAGEFSFP